VSRLLNASARQASGSIRPRFALVSRFTFHVSPFPHEHRRHRPEPPFVARGTAGTVRLCRGENSEALKSLRESGIAGEAVILSTCNRVEIYAATSLDPAKAIAELKQFFARWARLLASRKKLLPLLGEERSGRGGPLAQVQIPAPGLSPLGRVRELKRRSTYLPTYATPSTHCRAAKPAPLVQGCVRYGFNGARRD